MYIFIGIKFSFTRNSSAVAESDGYVEVCIAKEGNTTLSFTVIVISGASTAFGKQLVLYNGLVPITVYTYTIKANFINFINFCGIRHTQLIFSVFIYLFIVYTCIMITFYVSVIFLCF